MALNQVVVVGGGLMGSGIAYVTALTGRNVTIIDREQQFVDTAISSIKEQIKDGISRGKMSPFEGQKLVEKVKGSTDLESAVSQADFVIEAVFENMDVKKEVFSQLSDYSQDGTILVSNTSTLSITEIASVVKSPSRVAGLHFFSPVAAMKLVEIIVGRESSDDTINQLKLFVDSLSKTYVIAKDSPGFIANRIMTPLLNEALKIVDAGVASMEDVDKTVVLGFNHPIGPFALSDMVGLDVALASLRTLESELGEFYSPSPTLVKLVDEGKLGMKTKEGFYKY